MKPCKHKSYMGRSLLQHAGAGNEEFMLLWCYNCGSIRTILRDGSRSKWIKPNNLKETK